MQNIQTNSADFLKEAKGNEGIRPQSHTFPNPKKKKSHYFISFYKTEIQQWTLLWSNLEVIDEMVSVQSQVPFADNRPWSMNDCICV